MATYISHSAGETEALGESWGRLAASGWVIGLSGELGSGKTQLVKGLARGLGVPGRMIHSPTFTLVNVYHGTWLRLFHLDLYRLDGPEQIVAAGLEEYLNPAGVTVIEWMERWLGSAPDGKGRLSGGRPGRWLRWVEIEILSENERRFEYEDLGA